MKSSRLSSGWSREQCPYRPPFQNDTTCPRARKTAIRLAWDEETLGAAPRRATIAISSRGRADHRHPSSKRNDAGATPAGSNSSQRTECAARLLSGVSLVDPKGRSHFNKGARPVGRGRCLENSRTVHRCPRFNCVARERLFVRSQSALCRAAGAAIIGAPRFSRPCSSTDLERSSPKGSDASATLARDNARMVQ